MKKLCKVCPFREGDKKTMREQAERIVELKKEVNDISLKLEVFRSKEAEANSALAFAKQKAEELKNEAVVKYALECERLRIYRDKWQKYIDGRAKAGELALNIKKTDQVLRECQLMLEEMMYSDLDIGSGSVAQDYIAERDRLDDEPQLNYESIAIKTRKKAGEERISDEEIDAMLKLLKEEI